MRSPLTLPPPKIWNVHMVDYNMGEGIYMLPSDMNPAGYNNKILVSDNGFSLGRDDTVNASVPK